MNAGRKNIWIDQRGEVFFLTSEHDEKVSLINRSALFAVQFAVNKMWLLCFCPTEVLYEDLQYLTVSFLALACLASLLMLTMWLLDKAYKKIMACKRRREMPGKAMCKQQNPSQWISSNGVNDCAFRWCQKNRFATWKCLVNTHSEDFGLLALLKHILPWFLVRIRAENVHNQNRSLYMEDNYVTKTNKNKKIKRFVCLFLLQISSVLQNLLHFCGNDNGNTTGHLYTHSCNTLLSALNRHSLNYMQFNR